MVIREYGKENNRDACLIREGTCCTSDQCDYCICGDRNPLAKEFELVRTENGLLLSMKKEK